VGEVGYPGAVTPDTPPDPVPIGTGSGFLVTADMVLTCRHVVGDAAQNVAILYEVATSLYEVALYQIKDGSHRSRAWAAVNGRNARTNLDLDLRIHASAFNVTADERGHNVLEDQSGRRFHRGFAPRLLVASEDATSSILYPVSSIEHHTNVEFVAPSQSPQLADAGGGFGRLVQRAAVRLAQQIERSSAQLTFSSLWRRLIRLAASILRQLLRQQRRQLPKTTEAVSHCHTVDQHRLRGPSRARKALSPQALREPAHV
jgi:hypothetical protein